MKLLALLLFVLGSYATCLAQPAALPTATPAVAAPIAPLARPLPDSVRQAVQQLFRRGRRFSLLGGLSGAAVLSSGIIYTAGAGRG